MTGNYHDQVMGMVQEIMSSSLQNRTKLYNTLRLLAKYRSQLIVNTIT
jgi:hypothetical protein